VQVESLRKYSEPTFNATIFDPEVDFECTIAGGRSRKRVVVDSDVASTSTGAVRLHLGHHVQAAADRIALLRVLSHASSCYTGDTRAAFSQQLSANKHPFPVQSDGKTGWVDSHYRHPLLLVFTVMFLSPSLHFKLISCRVSRVHRRNPHYGTCGTDASLPTASRFNRDGLDAESEISKCNRGG